MVSVFGALIVLAAYVANQLRWIGPSNLSYALLNFFGTGILAVIALVEKQWGFLLLEGAWALISLCVAARLRGGLSSETAGRAAWKGDPGSCSEEACSPDDVDKQSSEDHRTEGGRRMDREPVIVQESAREWETWPDEEVTERGSVYWRTLVSGDLTHSEALTVGIAKIPAA